MKTSRHTAAQIIAILRQAKGDVPVAQLFREHGMSDASFYKWWAKYGGMDASMVHRMKGMEEDNRPLKRMYSDLSIQTLCILSHLQQQNILAFLFMLHLIFLWQCIYSMHSFCQLSSIV